MTKACVRDDAYFGVCRIVRGDEVRPPGAGAPEFATVGTLARIESWDMPEQGILSVTAAGATRFDGDARTRRRRTASSSRKYPRSPRSPSWPSTRGSGRSSRCWSSSPPASGPRQFPAARSYDDASWVGYRLAELLPLSASVKQNMLEINDAEVRLSVLEAFLKAHGLL